MFNESQWPRPPHVAAAVGDARARCQPISLAGTADRAMSWDLFAKGVDLGCRYRNSHDYFSDGREAGSDRAVPREGGTAVVRTGACLYLMGHSHVTGGRSTVEDRGTEQADTWAVRNPRSPFPLPGNE